MRPRTPWGLEQVPRHSRMMASAFAEIIYTDRRKGILPACNCRTTPTDPGSPTRRKGIEVGLYRANRRFALSQ